MENLKDEEEGEADSFISSLKVVITAAECPKANYYVKIFMKTSRRNK